MLTIIGCGNPNRSDDGVGTEVVRRLRETLDEEHAGRVQIFDAGTDGMSVMFRARGATALIIVDACQSGAEAGAIFEVPGREFKATVPPGLNLHAFRWDHALFVGRQIFKDEFPSDVVVYLVESQSLDYGLGLSHAVQRAREIVIEKIIQHIVLCDTHKDVCHDALDGH